MHGSPSYGSIDQLPWDNRCNESVDR